MEGRLKKCILMAAAAVWLTFGATAHAADRPLVVFVNPGAEDDAFFGMTTSFMQAAADDLGFELEVYYGDRNHVLIDENVMAIFNRKPLPDYVIGMNARGAGKTMVERAEASGVKLIFINQGFLGVERVEMRLPGEKYKNWLFELLPNDVHSGYLLAKSLIEARMKEVGPDAKIEMLAISGHDESSASRLRVQGLKRALVEYPNVHLNQTVPAMWLRDKARTVTQRLLKRYPQTTVVWAASDIMGLGVLDAVTHLGMKPGRDVLVGGVDWAADGLGKVQSGEFAASVGGHFMEGGWALVMLYDLRHGVPVPNQSRSDFSVLTGGNIREYLANFGDRDWSRIDFTKFSKAENPALLEYPFGLDSLLEQVR